METLPVKLFKGPSYTLSVPITGHAFQLLALPFLGYTADAPSNQNLFYTVPASPLFKKGAWGVSESCQHSEMASRIRFVKQSIGDES